MIDLESAIERLCDIALEDPGTKSAEILVRCGDRWLREVASIERNVLADGRQFVTITTGQRSTLPDNPAAWSQSAWIGDTKD